MRKVAFVFFVALMSGCAVNSGVVATGSDSYFVSRQGAAVYGMANLKGEALGEASQFCAAKGKALHVVSQTDAQPPFIFGNYPKTDLQFKCV